MISSTQTNQPFTSPAREARDSDAFVMEAIGILRKSGCRITRMRTKLLKALAERTEPSTIEELHSLVGHSECDLVTVYRSMARFEELGLVSRTYRHSGTTLYERTRGGERPYRVVCKISNRIAQIDPALALPVQKAIREIEDALRARGYNQVSHVLEFFAVNPNVENSERSQRHH